MMVDNISGWWFQPSPLKNHGVKVSWDDMTFPTVSGKSYLIHSMVPVTTNQIYIYIHGIHIPGAAFLQLQPPSNIKLGTPWRG